MTIGLLLVSALALAEDYVTLEALGADEPELRCFTGHPRLAETGIPVSGDWAFGFAIPGARMAHSYEVHDVGDISFIGGPWSYQSLNGDHIYRTLDAFLQTHENDYDFVSIFVTRSLNFGAFYAPLQNDTRGIGSPMMDETSGFGFDELEGFLFMNSIYDYDGGSRDAMFFGQELGHRWGAFVRRDGGGSDMLGRDQSHWSFFVHSGNSAMEGNHWNDVGGGRFETDHLVDIGYSDLDLYLMGLMPPDEVEDWFLIDNPNVVRDPLGWMQGDTARSTTPYYAVLGYISESEADSLSPIEVSGTRIDVGIDDVIDAHGERDPEFGDAPDEFRMAFVVMHPASETVDFEEYLEIEDIRDNLVELWEEMAEERAELHTDLGWSDSYELTPADFPLTPYEPEVTRRHRGCASVGGAGAPWLFIWLGPLLFWRTRR